MRYGYEAEAALVQDLYLSGQKQAAADALPEELVTGVALIGTPDEGAGRVEAFRAAGVTLNAQPHEHRVKDIALLRQLAG